MFHPLIVILILIRTLSGREKIFHFGKNPPRSKGAQWFEKMLKGGY